VADSSPIPTPHQARAKVAGLVYRRDPGDPDIADAKRALNEANLTAHIKRIVDDSPALTQEQRDRLAQLLRGGAQK
jgi:hypothetical protein